MTSFSSKFYIVFMLLCLVLLLIISNCDVEARFCGEPSMTYSGKCDIHNSRYCNKHCVNMEFAAYGVCFDNGGLDCFCYIEC
ncbi:unnamed protein product [Trifolium pratense]|uniref:Uncharacterized protein n=1 Tax=Trifolium pratense TaxID=57577 RepID=A0ACB0ISX1_TRIPR|nr:unnamed protein product [Trifolium pratense]